jgi:hypothetical protein
MKEGRGGGGGVEVKPSKNLWERGENGGGGVGGGIVGGEEEEDGGGGGGGGYAGVDTRPNRLHSIRPAFAPWLACWLRFTVGRGQGKELWRPVNVIVFTQTKLPKGVVAWLTRIIAGLRL